MEAMVCPRSTGLIGDRLWSPAQSGRFPGKTHESIKPTNPIDQSVFIRASCVQLFSQRGRRGGCGAQAAAETRDHSRIAGIWRLFFVGWVVSPVIGPPPRVGAPDCGCFADPGRTPAAQHAADLPGDGPPGASAGPTEGRTCGLYKKVT